MKRIAICAALAAIGLSSCARYISAGVIYENTTLPCSYSSVSGNKVGKSSCVNILGLVSIGDASLIAAKMNGGISAISTHDEKVQMILGGIISRKTTIVSGQ